MEEILFRVEHSILPESFQQRMSLWLSASAAIDVFLGQAACNVSAPKRYSHNLAAAPFFSLVQLDEKDLANTYLGVLLLLAFRFPNAACKSIRERLSLNVRCAPSAPR